MKKFSFDLIIRKQPPKDVFIEAIWKSRHRHLSISIVLESALASTLQKIWFCPQKPFFENRILMFFLVLSYDISTTLLQIRFPCHPSNGVRWCSRQRLFEHSEAPVRGCCEKTTASKISEYFACFPAKHRGWSSF